MYKKFGLLFCLFICGSCRPIINNGEEPADLSILDLPDGVVGPGELDVLASATCTQLAPDPYANQNIPIEMVATTAKIELKNSLMSNQNNLCMSPAWLGGKVLRLSCDVSKDSLKKFTKTRQYLITIQQNVLLPAAIANTEFAGVSGTISLTLTPSQGTPIVINTNPSQTVHLGGSFPSDKQAQKSNVLLWTPPVDLSMANLKVEFTAIVACSGNNPLLPSRVQWDIELLKLTPL